MKRTASVDINLDALTHNLSIVRNHAPSAKVMAVVKANAYGHGLLKVAQHLQDKTEALAVACIEEAVMLRENGICSKLVVLQGFHHRPHLEQCYQYQLEPVCHQHWQVELLLEHDAGSALDIWLKVDTGMHRLGIPYQQAQTVFRQATDSANVGKIQLMSHFACADVPSDPLNNQQLELFNQVQQQLNIEASLANSAAVLSRPDAIKDWIRPGIMLYGSSPLLDKTAAELNLQAVMTLSSQVISLKQIKAGESVGYGSDWSSKRDSTIAAIAVGYGDGYPRHAVSGTPVLINGLRCEIVGRVSMDTVTVDITGIEDKVSIGDTAILWGESPAIDEIAQSASTIAYELLCHVGKDR